MRLLLLASCLLESKASSLDDRISTAYGFGFWQCLSGNHAPILRAGNKLVLAVGVFFSVAEGTTLTPPSQL